MTELEVNEMMVHLRDYVRAEIREATDDDPDSLGSYYEERTLREFLLSLVDRKASS